MPKRKTPLRKPLGVTVIQVDAVSPDGTRARSTHDRLTPLRPNPPRAVGEARDALDAFALQFIASGADPVMQQTLDRGQT